MSAWAVEVLNKAVEAELLALPKDMQARFVRISELLQIFGPQQVGILHAFVKKTQKTPLRAIDLARKRLREVGP